MSLHYQGVEPDSILNGEGIRVVLWLSGCSHHCKGCQNPQTWDPNSGSDNIEHAFELVCEELDHDWVSGLTLSGGDPLYPDSIPEVTNFVKRIKEKYPNKTIWMYTGFEYEYVKHLEVLEYVDVLVDGKFVEDLKDVNYPWAGSTNQKVIDLNAKRHEDPEIRKSFKFAAC